MTEGEVAASEIGELYRVLAKPLERIVRSGVHAPQPVIEDACQFAWTRLVVHRSRVGREGVLGWLAKTATREAFKLIGRHGRELSLDTEVGAGVGGLFDLRPGPGDICEQRERLSALGALSPRQQRLLWLYGFGLSYKEIATRDLCTPRAVERQLKRARASLRAVELGR